MLHKPDTHSVVWDQLSLCDDINRLKLLELRKLIE